MYIYHFDLYIRVMYKRELHDKILIVFCILCTFVRWAMTGTWRVVNKSVCVTVEVCYSVITPAVTQLLRAANYKMENMNATLWVC